MRIMFWNEAFLPNIGGQEVFTMRLAQGLIDRGHEIAVVTGIHTEGLADSEVLNGVHIHRFRFLDAITGAGSQCEATIEHMMDLLPRLASVKKSFRPDLVHVNFAGTTPFFHLRTSKAHNAPTLVTFQAALNDRFKLSKGLLAQVIQRAARIVAVSSAAAENMAAFTGYPRDKIVIIAPGIPADEFTSRQEMSGSETPTVVFLGRLVSEKGADVAIEAVARLNGAAHLHIIGDGPQRKDLEDLVRARSVSHLVSFKGRVDDETRKHLLAKSTIMVVPSLHQELFGMVAVEGALSGLPIVASAVGGLSEVVGDRGLLFPPGDVLSLAKSLDLLITNRSLALWLGECGRSHALANYSVERMVAAYERLYMECERAAETARESLRPGPILTP
jgi:glycosyltransferase involved in cell wall biosynthesis